MGGVESDLARHGVGVPVRHLARGTRRQPAGTVLAIDLEVVAEIHRPAKVIHRDHARGPALLAAEGVGAVERVDVEHRFPAHVGHERSPVAQRLQRYRAEGLDAIAEIKRVKPRRHRIDRALLVVSHPRMIHSTTSTQCARIVHHGPRRCQPTTSCDSFSDMPRKVVADADSQHRRVRHRNPQRPRLRSA